MLPENNGRTGSFEQEQYEAVLANLPDYLRGLRTMGYWTGRRMVSQHEQEKCLARAKQVFYAHNTLTAASFEGQKPSLPEKVQ